MKLYKYKNMFNGKTYFEFILMHFLDLLSHGGAE